MFENKPKISYANYKLQCDTYTMNCNLLENLESLIKDELEIKSVIDLYGDNDILHELDFDSAQIILQHGISIERYQEHKNNLSPNHELIDYDIDNDKLIFSLVPYPYIVKKHRPSLSDLYSAHALIVATKVKAKEKMDLYTEQQMIL